jgi:hypothetical protein
LVFYHDFARPLAQQLGVLVRHRVLRCGVRRRRAAVLLLPHQ